MTLLRLPYARLRQNISIPNKPDGACRGVLVLRGRLAELGKEGGGGDEVSAAVDDGHSAAPRHRRLHVAPLRKTPATYHEYHGVVPPSRPLPRPDRGGGGCAEAAEGVARDEVGGILGREAVARQRRC